MSYQPDENAVHKRTWGEGEYPPVASAGELRGLLNSVWEAVFPDPNLANPEPAEEIRLRLDLAMAELVFHRGVRESELTSRDLQRNVVPVEYLDAYVKRNHQQALEEGRRQGCAEAEREHLAWVATVEALLPVDAPDDPVRQALGNDTAAAEYVAKIERAAYDRGLSVAGGIARDRVEELLSEIANVIADKDSKNRELDRLRLQFAEVLEIVRDVSDIATMRSRIAEIIQQ